MKQNKLKALALLFPYFAIILGLYVFRNAWLAFVIYHALIIIVVKLVFKNGKSSNVSALIKGWNARTALPMIIFGLAGGILMFALWPYLNVEGLGQRLSRFGLSGVSLVLFVIYHSAINSWFEEYFWRGYLSDINYPVIGDVFFAGYHVLVLVLFMTWQWVVVCFGILVMAARVWRITARKHHGLIIPVLSHIAADAAIMLVILLKLHT